MFGKREAPEDEPVNNGPLENGTHRGVEPPDGTQQGLEKAPARSFWPSVSRDPEPQHRFDSYPVLQNESADTSPASRSRPGFAPWPRTFKPEEDPIEAAQKLMVGKMIYLSGEIKDCEALVIEGRVEADLTDCKVLLIQDSGSFRGSAEVEDADISGHFEGDMTVTGTMKLRKTGRISGTLRYAEIQIERGGQVTGSLEKIPPPQKPAQAAKPKQKASPAPEKTTAN